MDAHRTKQLEHQATLSVLPTEDEDENSFFEVSFHNYRDGYASSGKFYRTRVEAVEAYNKEIEEKKTRNSLFVPLIEVHQFEI